MSKTVHLMHADRHTEYRFTDTSGMSFYADYGDRRISCYVDGRNIDVRTGYTREYLRNYVQDMLRTDPQQCDLDTSAIGPVFIGH